MEWIAKTKKLNILHAGNGREKKINEQKVDSYVPDLKIVYEFLGKRLN